MRAGLAALLMSLGAVGQVQAAPDDGIRIDMVRAHLFYERSGRLSEDLIGRDPPFIGWNTVIGEGDAQEPAENLLVVAVLSNPGEESYLSEKLSITVWDESGGEVKTRDFDGLLLGARSSLHLPLWIENAGCVGSIAVEVKFREQTLSRPLQLECGE